jgi:hypothetical protein
MLKLKTDNKNTPLKYAEALHEFRGKLGNTEAYGYLSSKDFTQLKEVTGDETLDVVFKKYPKSQIVFAVLFSTINVNEL